MAPDLRRCQQGRSVVACQWIKEPKNYWPATKMPNFRFSWEESEAAAAYLLSSSTPYNGPKYPGNGNSETGKQLVESIGCLGCHQISGVGNAFAPRSKPGGQQSERRLAVRLGENPRSICPPRRCLTYASAMSRPPTSPPT